MSKFLDCGKINPTSGCGHILVAENEEELLQLAAGHAKDGHGVDPSPALLLIVKANIEEGEFESSGVVERV
ncbi:MAG: DUF1059 domain-containing protein [Dehalococcoidia bacterium]|nr:DUF1059 domain-containing protein [Dehalococcoidia bacterium]